MAWDYMGRSVFGISSPKQQGTCESVGPDSRHI